MGNRANVVFTDGKEYSPAVYLHWNGGPESIYAFLNEMNRRKIRAGDVMYESARFCHIVGDFFDQKTISGLSLGLANGPKSDKPKDLAKIYSDLGDNGIYLVRRESNGNGKVKITMRRFQLNYDNVKDWEKDKPVMVEMDALAVERERKEAMKSDYIPSITKKFEEITQGKEIEK